MRKVEIGGLGATEKREDGGKVTERHLTQVRCVQTGEMREARGPDSRQVTVIDGHTGAE